jgi:hypothetical protein
MKSELEEIRSEARRKITEAKSEFEKQMLCSLSSCLEAIKLRNTASKEPITECEDSCTLRTY